MVLLILRMDAANQIASWVEKSIDFGRVYENLWGRRDAHPCAIAATSIPILLISTFRLISHGASSMASSRQ